MKHSELVEIGYNWLIKSVKCPFAFKELQTHANETPDVIGWKNGNSIVIECKTSRADFLADQKKLFRSCGNTAMGNYRFYLTPKGMLNPGDIPVKWCWLEVDGKGKIIERIAPVGNVWSDWPQFETYLPSELKILRSALRRISSKINIQELLNYPGK